jgi:acetoin utilization deacetylase AcuC-like enzyme
VATGLPRPLGAFGVWSEAIRDGVLAMQAGQLHGAALAFAGAPVVGNVAQGFHHARPHIGNGFCTFNGLALIAEAYPERTIGVLDVDEHEGDGTSVFSMGLPNLRHPDPQRNPSQVKKVLYSRIGDLILY